MLIYFDTCCLNRPFDDQRQTRVRLESEAVLALLSEVSSGEHGMASSAVLQYEVNRIADQTRRYGVLHFLGYAEAYQPLSSAVQTRAALLCTLGFKQMDALHLASAEQMQAGYFLSTDARLVGRATLNASVFKIAVANPLNFPPR